jgi:hypothetical protein
MPRNYVLALPLACLLSVMAFLAIYTSSAKAALDGADGRILLTDNSELSEDVQEPVTSVSTMNPDGSDLEVAATSGSEITAATISAPQPDNGHLIVYATEEYTSCDGYCYASDAVINSVNINKDGSPTSLPTVVTVMPAMNDPYDEDYETDYNRVYDLSISPDSTTVVAAQIGSIYYGEDSYWDLTSLSVVDLETGDIDYIVEPNNDYYLNGGYAQNGDIYFTKSTCDMTVTRGDCEAAVYLLSAGSDTAVALEATTTNEINEFYIDITSDSATILVADIQEGCSYNYMVMYNSDSYPGLCNYYYVDTATGATTLVDNTNILFVPKFFSPEDDYVVGTLFSELQFGRSAFSITPFEEVTTRPATAIALRIGNSWGEPIAISSQLGVQEWAPVNPVSTVVPAGETLANTGSNVAVFVGIIAILVTFSAISIFGGVLAAKKN